MNFRSVLVEFELIEFSSKQLFVHRAQEFKLLMLVWSMAGTESNKKWEKNGEKKIKDWSWEMWEFKAKREEEESYALLELCTFSSVLILFHHYLSWIM